MLRRGWQHCSGTHPGNTVGEHTRGNAAARAPTEAGKTWSWVRPEQRARCKHARSGRHKAARSLPHPTPKPPRPATRPRRRGQRSSGDSPTMSPATGCHEMSVPKNLLGHQLSYSIEMKQVAMDTRNRSEMARPLNASFLPNESSHRYVFSQVCPKPRSVLGSWRPQARRAFAEGAGPSNLPAAMPKVCPARA